MSEQDKSSGTDAQSDSAAPDNIDPVEGLHSGGGASDAPPSGDKTAAKKKAKALIKAKPPGGKTAAAFNVPWLALLALLLTGGVGYGVYYNFQQLQQVQQTNQSQSAEHQSLVDEVAQLRQHLNQAEAHNQQLLAQLNTSAQERQAIQQSIDKLSEQLAKKGRGPLQWRVAEVDYLLTIANQRLILQRDVKTATSALADADARLQDIADPALIPVRKDIASEINALKSVQLPDIAGMAVTLQGLTNNIEHLPLINKEHVFNRKQATDGPVKDWRELPGALWKDIKSLVTIRRNQQPVERLLPPEEQHYLYQNLGLKLEQARIALLQQDSVLFQRNLTDIRDWLQRYFDPDSTAVANVINTIGELAAVELKPKLPDISASLRTLREWSASQQAHAAVNTIRPNRLAALQHKQRAAAGRASIEARP